jgi:cobalt/nickel transport system permease protein
MHMADALVSPAVGGAMWAVSAGAVAYSSSKLRAEVDDRRVPLMGVMGAFLFAAQMINFSIPGTGSSGHLGGGILLAILLGPHAALLAITGVLIVQALFFADGGLLALGCNIFNMGVIPAFLVYPLLYKRLAGQDPGGTRLTFAIVVSALVTLQLGPFAVVLETLLSGMSALPFTTFLLMMQPVHLAIGVVEGGVTAAIISFAYLARPELLHVARGTAAALVFPTRNLLLAFLCAAILTGGVVSLIASKDPDGLEWAIIRVTGTAELKSSDNKLHKLLATIQEQVAVLPDYTFKKPVASEQPVSATVENKGGTSLAGIVGVGITLVLLIVGGALLKRGRASL